MGTDAAFATLGVAVGAQPIEITRAFRALSRRSHPDTGGEQPCLRRSSRRIAPCSAPASCEPNRLSTQISQASPARSRQLTWARWNGASERVECRVRPIATTADTSTDSTGPRQ